MNVNFPSGSGNANAKSKVLKYKFCQMENTGPVQSSQGSGQAQYCSQSHTATFPNILLLFLRRLTAEYASFSQTLILTENESPHAPMMENNVV